MKSLKAPLGHREVAITTGAYNKKDPLDWCHKIHCQCGYEDIAWNYEDAAQARDDHWADIREEQGETAQEETPDPVPVPGSGTGETGTSSRTTQTKPRRLVY